MTWKKKYWKQIVPRLDGTEYIQSGSGLWLWLVGQICARLERRIMSHIKLLYIFCHKIFIHIWMFWSPSPLVFFYLFHYPEPIWWLLVDTLHLLSKPNNFKAFFFFYSLIFSCVSIFSTHFYFSNCHVLHYNEIHYKKSWHTFHS